MQSCKTDNDETCALVVLSLGYMIVKHQPTQIKLVFPCGS